MYDFERDNELISSNIYKILKNLSALLLEMFSKNITDKLNLKIEVIYYVLFRFLN